MTEKPSEKNLKRMRKFVQVYTRKSGTYTHPDVEITEAVILGLADYQDRVGKPLCPCRFYPDPVAEAKHRTWICACDDMKIYKYCHCLLFVNEEGLPITEYLPADHIGRQTYGLVEDPHPEKGCESQHKAAERERERRERGT